MFHWDQLVIYLLSKVQDRYVTLHMNTIDTLFICATYRVRKMQENNDIKLQVT